MTQLKPYFDDVQTRSKLLKLIEHSQDTGLIKSPELKEKCTSLYSFYRSPAPFGYQYAWDYEWVMGTKFKELYSKLQRLLWEGIDTAKTSKTKDKKRLEALELAVSIWEKGYGVDETTGRVPLISTKELENDAELRKKYDELREASIQSAWKT